MVDPREQDRGPSLRQQPGDLAEVDLRTGAQYVTPHVRRGQTRNPCSMKKSWSHPHPGRIAAQGPRLDRPLPTSTPEELVQPLGTRASGCSRWPYQASASLSSRRVAADPYAMSAWVGSKIGTHWISMGSGDRSSAASNSTRPMLNGEGKVSSSSTSARQELGREPPVAGSAVAIGPRATPRRGACSGCGGAGRRWCPAPCGGTPRSRSRCPGRSAPGCRPRRPGCASRCGPGTSGRG